MKRKCTRKSEHGVVSTGRWAVRHAVLSLFSHHLIDSLDHSLEDLGPASACVVLGFGRLGTALALGDDSVESLALSGGKYGVSGGHGWSKGDAQAEGKQAKVGAPTHRNIAGRKRTITTHSRHFGSICKSASPAGSRSEPESAACRPWSRRPGWRTGRLGWKADTDTVTLERVTRRAEARVRLRVEERRMVDRRGGEGSRWVKLGRGCCQRQERRMQGVQDQ